MRRAGCSPRDDPRTQSRTRGWSRSAHATRHFSHHVRHTVARSKESGSPPTFDSLRVRTSRRRGSISFCVSCSYGAQEAPREDRVVNLNLALPPRGCEGPAIGPETRIDLSSPLSDEVKGVKCSDIGREPKKPFWGISMTLLLSQAPQRRAGGDREHSLAYTAARLPQSSREPVGAARKVLRLSQRAGRKGQRLCATG